jgi:nucleoside-diphosphate-sugar epimerase
MNLLIIGADGFIGSSLRDYFFSKKYNLYCTVLNERPSKGEFFLDITNPDSFTNLPRVRFDAVINAAGIVDQNVSKKTMFKINSEGVKNILSWMAYSKSSGLIQLSSVSVYGLKTLGQNRSEELTTRYKGYFALPYMKSKSLAEIYIKNSGINHVILRLGPVLEKGDSFFSRAIIMSLLNEKFCFCGKK